MADADNFRLYLHGFKIQFFRPQVRTVCIIRQDTESGIFCGRTVYFFDAGSGCYVLATYREGEAKAVAVDTAGGGLLCPALCCG